MGSSEQNSPKHDPAYSLVDHFFRHESGRLVSLLTRLFSLKNLDIVEDVVQAALLDALRVWRTKGIPENPSAWVRQVAKNKLLDRFRREKSFEKYLHRSASESFFADFDDRLLDTEIEDSQLQLFFTCCHPLLDVEDQIGLTLKMLCGFSLKEIASGLLVSEESIKKRLQRAKTTLIEANAEMALPAAQELESRLAVVQQVLYLLFNEGYYSTTQEKPIREDLCEEAIRLCRLLADHPRYGSPSTHALLALMFFHVARFDSRLNDSGSILLLEEQDRSLWDKDLLRLAVFFHNKSARGQRISTYHLEAGIAYQHCSAASFSETDWACIVQLYDVLLKSRPSPVYRLNRAIAISYRDGPEAGIAALAELSDREKAPGPHLVYATRAMFHFKAGKAERARELYLSAIACARTTTEKDLLERRLAQTRTG